ncbi:uncharacterized protein LOC119662322 isoform X2 [Teleopsis dalmanni]|nr:uncharacterized protein LOC119662322 isoform X2 [Teleopsis dalmanni]
MKRKKRQLHEAETKTLIEAVKSNPVIWSRQHKDHYNSNALKSAWENVSEEVCLNVKDCKSAWRSVTDSKRYYANKLKKYHMMCGYENNDYWSFQNNLLFLENKSPERATFILNKDSECNSITTKSENHSVTTISERNLVASIIENNSVPLTCNYSTHTETPNTSDIIKSSTFKYKKKRQLNEKVTKALIKAVASNPTIWNKKFPGHWSKVAHKRAWDNVSKAVSVSIDDCKSCWRSVRDSKRYYANKLKNPTNDCDMERDEYWIYQDELSFLESTMPPNGTLTVKQESEDNVKSSDIRQNDQNNTEMPSTSQNVRNTALNMLTLAADKIAAQMESFVRIKTDEENQKEKFDPVLNLLGSILVQLPEVEAQALSEELTALAYAKLNEQLSKYVKIEYT